MTPPSGRNVRRHQRFLDALRVILRAYPRAEEVIRGAEWSIARAPDRDGVHVGGNVWQAKLTKSWAMPEARLYYTFDDRHVNMMDISLVLEN